MVFGSLFACWVILHVFLSAGIFPPKKSLWNTISVKQFEIKIRLDIPLGLIRVQTVSKDHQDVTKFSAARQ